MAAVDRGHPPQSPQRRGRVGHAATSLALTQIGDEIDGIQDAAFYPRPQTQSVPRTAKAIPRNHKRHRAARRLSSVIAAPQGRVILHVMPDLAAACRPLPARTRGAFVGGDPYSHPLQPPGLVAALQTLTSMPHHRRTVRHKKACRTRSHTATHLPVGAGAFKTDATPACRWSVASVEARESLTERALGRFADASCSPHCGSGQTRAHMPPICSGLRMVFGRRHPVAVAICGCTAEYRCPRATPLITARRTEIPTSAATSASLHIQRRVPKSEKLRGCRHQRSSFGSDPRLQRFSATFFYPCCH